MRQDREAKYRRRKAALQGRKTQLQYWKDAKSGLGKLGSILGADEWVAYRKDKITKAELDIAQLEKLV